jgi:muramoyltetrapeptide carboxypeptidase LdcA involved in peptidoglycan recycling
MCKNYSTYYGPQTVCFKLEKEDNMAKRRNHRNVVRTQNNPKAQTQAPKQESESWFKRNRKKILAAGALLATGLSCFVAGRVTAPKDDLPWESLPEETTDEEE